MSCIVKPAGHKESSGDPARFDWSFQSSQNLLADLHIHIPQGFLRYNMHAALSNGVHVSEQRCNLNRDQILAAAGDAFAVS